MEARVIKQPKIFEKLELIIENKEEAELLWALLGLSIKDTEEALKFYSRISDGCRKKLALTSLEMFATVDSKFTPEWYNDC